MITEKRRTELKKLFIEDPDGKWMDDLTQEEKVIVLYLEMAYYIGKQQVINMILENIRKQLLQNKQSLEADFQEELQTIGRKYVDDLNTDLFTQVDWEFYGLQAIYENFPIPKASFVLDFIWLTYMVKNCGEVP